MTADKFAELVRAGNEKLRVDNVVVDTGSGKLRGRGILRIEPEKLTIDLTLSGRHEPPAHKRVTTKKDAWKLTGLIDNHLRFRCDNVSPGGRWNTFNSIVTITRKLHSIELVTERFDSAKATRKRRAMEKRLKLKPSDDPDEYKPDRSFSFEATLVNCEVPAVNSGTKTTWQNDFLGEWWSSSADTFTGELATARYAFVRAENGHDLDIYLRSKDESRSISEEDDWRKFRALLAAFAFTNGAQPWPFRIKYFRGGHRISERISAARSLPSTSYSPFNRAIGVQESEHFGKAIRAAAEFLESGTPLNRQLTNLLFLFREAGKKSIQLEIRILALCAVLEGLVRTIYKEMRLEDAAPSSSRKAKREFPPAQDVFKAVAKKLEIPWKEKMEPLFIEWRRARNPSAHGEFRAEVEAGGDEQQLMEQLFYGLSRIAGGFNMILLKLFGYSGIYYASPLEDIYQKV